jgi:hypothetical protein
MPRLSARRVAEMDTMFERLLAEHEIAQLKYRYMRGIDTHDWDLLASCFTEDVELWPSKGNYVARGRQEVVDLLRAVIDDGFVSTHVAAHPEIAFDGPDRASGIWRLEDVVFYTRPNPTISHIGVRGGEELSGAGYYHDDYVRTPAGWLIARSGYVRIFEAIRRPGEASASLAVDPDRGMLADAR